MANILSNLTSVPLFKKKKKLLGHGYSSGHGATSTRGMKGQRARSGGGPRVGFEGGQMPLIRRLPKRGFSNAKFERKYEIVNLSLLEKKFNPGDEVTEDILREKGIIRKALPVKILGSGALTKPLKVTVSYISEGARKKIISAGGTVTLLNKEKCN
jgi:large subunit ribosomal protein L15